MAGTPEPEPAKYAALLEHFFRRLPADINGLSAFDVFEGADFPQDDQDVPPLFAHAMQRSGQDLAEFNDAQLGVGLSAMFSISWSGMGCPLPRPICAAINP
jgi:hypothetical protein